MDQKEIKEKAKKIKKAYDKYNSAIEDLRKKQNKVVGDFMKQIEEEKIKEVLEFIKKK